ncbi:MAG TPA: MoaD/ThiS family protein [Patescibacteria group bacterium]|nr:MoaD/ThiS family protein [Patescibacteria group bacterium]
MAGEIELRAFMGLSKIFKERNWPSPLLLKVSEGLTAYELLKKVELAPEQVEVIFINGKVVPLDDAVIKPGDRVALAPPGTPGPYRVLLGFRKMD